MGNVVSFASLNHIELRCLRQVAEGKSETEIGAQLELPSSEVASTLSNVLIKLDCPNKIAAIAKAARLGLLAFENK